jgi:3-oxoacyl-[acyl-carrier protein] reductase
LSVTLIQQGANQQSGTCDPWITESVKVAVVVGGGKGLGLEVARMPANEGCRVAVVARTQTAIDIAVEAIRYQRGNAMGSSADVSQREEVEDAVE